LGLDAEVFARQFFDCSRREIAKAKIAKPGLAWGEIRLAAIVGSGHILDGPLPGISPAKRIQETHVTQRFADRRM